jgi:hypothetical protein
MRRAYKRELDLEFLTSASLLCQQTHASLLCQQTQARRTALQLKSLAVRDMNFPVAGDSHLSYPNAQFLLIEGRAPTNTAIENLFPTIGSVFQSQVGWMPTTNDIRVAEGDR